MEQKQDNNWSLHKPGMNVIEFVARSPSGMYLRGLTIECKNSQEVGGLGPVMTALHC